MGTIGKRAAVAGDWSRIEHRDPRRRAGAIDNAPPGRAARCPPAGMDSGRRNPVKPL